MSTSPSPNDTGKSNEAPKNGAHAKGAQAPRTQAPRKKQPVRKGAPRPRGAGATGSSSAATPARKRPDSTGSLSATNPGKRRPNGAGKPVPQGARRVRTGGRPAAGGTGKIPAGGTGKISVGGTGKVGTAGVQGVKGASGTKPAGTAKAAAGGKRVVKAGTSAPKHSSKQAPSRIPVPLIIGIAVAVVAVLVGGFFVAQSILHPYEGARVEDGKTVTVVIPEGSDGASIIQSLLDAGVIHSSKDFRRATARQNADQSLRSGTYTFVTGSDPDDVVRQLVKGPNTTEGVLQVPEGLTVAQTADVVEQSLGISASEFVQQAKASTYVKDYPFLKEASNDSLEGFLYPKTYNVAADDATADDVIRLMLSQFETEYASLDAEDAREALFTRYGLNVTDYDFIKIASIIEEEARSEEDRPLVSSVFYNRLSENMALQSDATISYETGQGFQQSDLTQDSPYNTYLYKGLPPTPISSPSEWAIDAAMHPSDTEYLFFFIIEDGTYSNHTFTKTFEEHDAAYAAALAEQAQVSAGGTVATTTDDESMAADNDATGTATTTGTATEGELTDATATTTTSGTTTDNDVTGAATTTTTTGTTTDAAGIAATTTTTTDLTTDAAGIGTTTTTDAGAATTTTTADGI